MEDERADGRADGDSTPSSSARRWSRVKVELLLALEVLALATVTFSRPVLEGFGAFPPLFAQYRAGYVDLVSFGLLVMLVPAVFVTSVGLAAGLVSRRVRCSVHMATVVLVGGVGGWRLGIEQTSSRWLAVPLVLLGVVVGCGLGWLRWWPKTADATASFLRIAGAVSAIFLVQFLFMSEASRADLVGDRPSEIAAAKRVAAALPEDSPPVVMVVFDALPTGMLLDGSGAVDAEVFPSFAELAGGSTWYRNHTTVAPFTTQAVPAILTGRYPDEAGRIDRPGQNVFSLLGAGYDLNVREPWTDLCHSRFCPEVPSFSGQGALLREAASFWRSGASAEPSEWLPARITPDRYEKSLAWVDATVEAVSHPGDRPPFAFMHTILPHRPRELTDDGVRYEAAGVPEDSFFDWGPWAATVGRQAHVLQTQAADRLLGQLVDGLKEAGVYDETLIVVTADHGEAFLPDQPARLVTPDTWPHVMWTPLLVKEPGQTVGEVDDGNLQTVDIVPTIAELLGVDLPWDVDGLPAGRVADERDSREKPIVVDAAMKHEAGEGRLVYDGEEGLARILAESAVEDPGTGPDAVWRRTTHGQLLRESLNDLAVGDPKDAELIVEVPRGLDAVDLGGPLPLEVVARTDLEAGSVVALVLNGEVAALAEVEEASPNRVHALLLPDLFVEGHNDLRAYLVKGTPGEETLRPLEAVP